MKRTNVAAAAFSVLLSLVDCGSSARAARDVPPQVAVAERGAKIEDVSIEAYGVTKSEIAMRYLALRVGDTLSQDAVVRDYENLKRLAGVRTRLEVRPMADGTGVSLRWIVLAPFFETTDHPFYGDQPLSIPIEGFGTIVTSQPLDGDGSNLSVLTQVALRAQLARIIYTKPVWVDPKSGRAGYVIFNYLGARGVYRASEPVTQDVYSWLQGEELLYLVRDTNGTQVEVGARTTRSTSAKPSYLDAPSLIDTNASAARTTTLEAGLSHGCPIAPTHWYPPNCYVQYRVEAFDSIGGLGANTEYRYGFGDVAQYTRIGSSTLALHASGARSGGILPTSILLCAYTFGYAKATCGTDTNLAQAEFRIADARPGPLKFILFTETASSRIRGAVAPAPASFQWRADSGVGIQFSGFRFNVASGSDGGRITYEVQGQLF